jgi:hypothetical protein
MRSMWNTCVEAVVKAPVACGQSMWVLHSQISYPTSQWKTTRLFRGLYTFCVRYYTATVGNFTSVSGQLYTLYTGLTKTTTKLNI